MPRARTARAHGPPGARAVALHPGPGRRTATVMCRRRPSGRRGSPPPGRDLRNTGRPPAPCGRPTTTGRARPAGPRGPRDRRSEGGPDVQDRGPLPDGGDDLHDDHARGGADDPAEDFPAPAGRDADSVPVPRAAAGAAADPPPPPDSEPHGMVPPGRGNLGIVGLRPRRQTGAPGTRHGERLTARPATGLTVAPEVKAPAQRRTGL